MHSMDKALASALIHHRIKVAMPRDSRNRPTLLASPTLRFHPRACSSNYVASARGQAFSCPQRCPLLIKSFHRLFLAYATLVLIPLHRSTLLRYSPRYLRSHMSPPLLR